MTALRRQRPQCPAFDDQHGVRQCAKEATVKTPNGWHCAHHAVKRRRAESVPRRGSEGRFRGLPPTKARPVHRAMELKF